MAGDPLGLTPDPTADDPQSPDYLGRMVPLAFKGQPALPVTGAPAVGSPAGPVGPGGGAAPAGLGGGERSGQPGLNFLSLAQRALSTGEDLMKLFGGQADLGTRGDTGGVSLSDYLRSSGLGVTGPAWSGAFQSAEALGATAAELQALGATGAEIGFGAGEAGAAAGEAGAAGAAELGASAGLSTGLSVMMLPWTINSIMNLFGAGVNAMDMFTGDKPTDYQKFAGKLQGNESQQGQGLSILQQALPYVQSKEELGRLLNTYRNYVSTTQDAPMTPGADPYQLTTISGMTGTEHGGHGPGVDWGPMTEGLQAQINQYKEALPGEVITAWYGEPGGGFQGDDLMRLWTQHTDRERTAPKYVMSDIPGYTLSTGEGEMTVDPIARGFYGQYVSSDALRYGQEGYDYAGSGFPEPGQFVGERNPLYASLFEGGGVPTGPQAPGPGFGQVAQVAMGPGAPGDSQAMSLGGEGEEYAAERMALEEALG